MDFCPFGQFYSFGSDSFIAKVLVLFVLCGCGAGEWPLGAGQASLIFSSFEVIHSISEAIY